MVDTDPAALTALGYSEGSLFYGKFPEHGMVVHACNRKILAMEAERSVSATVSSGLA